MSGSTKPNDFSQMKKNSVSSKGQLRETNFVRFENPEGNGIKVMFIGNSITLHGFLPSIGWHGEWGMAASQKENDYVHILMGKIRKSHPDAAFCICQVAEWERQYKNGASTHHYFENARAFDADIIVMRTVENCPAQDIDNGLFKKELGDLLHYLDPNKKAKFVLSTAFWHHPLDGAIEEYAAEKGLPIVLLGDLGEKDKMKALGLFEHEGVANHPGDLGMQTIAERLFSEIKKYL